MKIHDENDVDGVIIGDKTAQMRGLIQNNKSVKQLKNIKECFLRFKTSMENNGTYVAERVVKSTQTELERQ